MAGAWAPDWTEIDVYEYLRERMREEDVEPAWGPCPAVHAGPNAGIGHTDPEDRLLEPEEVLHVDFGVQHDGFVADIQRLYYYPDVPGDHIPTDLQGAFEDVRAALNAGLDRLKPGVAGYEVDTAAREALSDRGWSEFNHAFGHQVGRNPHDGGTLLGPRSDRYEDRSTGTVRAGEVYSVELGVGTTYGYLGQEEMVEVVEGGYEFLVEPQRYIRKIGE